MRISTRGRYALRVMIDLAEHQTDGYLPMKVVTQRQGLSLKYLEQILPVLVSGSLIEGMHGKHGGYRLARAPELISVGEILRLTEGDLAPVSCLGCGAADCANQESCRTIAMWRGFQAATEAYFDGITLDMLMRTADDGQQGCQDMRPRARRK